MSPLQIFKRHDLAVFLFFSLLWFLMLSYTGALTSGFHFTDDHEILAIKNQLSGQGAWDTYLGILYREIHSLGRLRLFYYLHRLIEVKAFGADLLIWSIYNGALAVFTSFSLYLFMRVAGFRTVEALLFPVLTLVGRQSAIWWCLGPAEAIGMFLLSLALLFMGLGACSQRNKILFRALSILLLFLSTLAKESFILAIPAFAFWMAWLSAEKEGLKTAEALKKNRIPILALLFIFASEILFIKYYVGPTKLAYAGFDGFGAVKFLIAGAAISLFGHAALISTGLVMVFIAVFARRDGIGRAKEIVKKLIPPLVLFSSIFLPQAVLYTKSGIDYRYLQPSMLGFAFLIVYLFRFTSENLALRMTMPTPAWAGRANVLWGTTLFLSSAALVYSEIHGIEMRREAPLLFKTLLVLTPPVFLALIAASLTRLKRGLFNALTSRAIYTALILVVIALSISQALWAAHSFAFEGRKTGEWLDSIDNNTMVGDIILVVADPAFGGEHAVSMKRYLDYEKGKKDIYLYPVLTRDRYSDFRKSLIERLNKSTFYGLYKIDDIRDKDLIKAVVLFPETEDKFLRGSAGWFIPASYRRYYNDYGYVSYYKK